MKKIYSYLMLAFVFFAAQEASAQCDAEFYCYSNGQGTFYFYDSTGSTYTSDDWTFGDGSTGTTTSGRISHTYARTGSYTVCRYVYDSASNCRDTFCKTITNKTFCRAAFGWSRSGDTFQFRSYSTNAYSHTWKFGDGSTSTSKNPSHAYSAKGYYSVCLIISDSAGTCSDSVCHQVYAPKPGCDARFYGYNSSGNTASFYDDSTGKTYTQNYWTFGDGSSDSTTSGYTTHTYASGGTYNVCRIVWDSSTNCRDTFCTTVTICSTKAKFGYTRGGGDTINFHDSSTGGVIYYWRFGDGSTSNAQNPVHVYQSGRSYTACLTVYDSSYRCAKSYCRTIVMSGSGGCNASFTTSQQKNYVSFRSTTSSPTLSYTWKFGDGTTGSGRYASHTYSVPSGYTVYTYNACLYIRDTSNNCTDSSCKAIVVRADTCSAQFSSSSYGLQAYFYNRSSNTSTTTYSWTFGDGNTSTARYPNHTYSARGTYYVCLTVADSNMGCSATYCDSITVDTINTSCTADFNFSVQDTTVYVTNASSGTGLSYYWWTSTGGSSSAANPTFTFGSPGTYSICLYVVDSLRQCSDSICKTVTIDSAKSCMAFFRVAVDTNKKYKVYLINGSSNKSSHKYKWDFGDGKTSSSRNPNHKYKSFGRYYVCLTVTDSKSNCSDTYCDSIGMDSTGKLLKAEGFELEVRENNLSVGDEPTVDFALYPNPVSDKLNIELNGAFSTEAFISVYALDGRLISKQNFELSGKATVDMSGHKNGLYIVKIFDGSNYTQAKLLKESN